MNKWNKRVSADEIVEAMSISSCFWDIREERNKGKLSDLQLEKIFKLFF